VQILLTSVGKKFYDDGALLRHNATARDIGGGGSPQTTADPAGATDGNDGSSNTAPPNPKGKLIGLGVGIGMAALLVPGALAVAIFIFRHQKRRQASETSSLASGRDNDNYYEDDDGDDDSDHRGLEHGGVFALLGYRVARLFGKTSRHNNNDQNSQDNDFPAEANIHQAADGALYPSMRLSQPPGTLRRGDRVGSRPTSFSPSTRGFIDAYRRIHGGDNQPAYNYPSSERKRYTASWVDPRLSELFNDFPSTADSADLSNRHLSILAPPPTLRVFNGRTVESVESLQDSMDYAPPIIHR